MLINVVKKRDVGGLGGLMRASCQDVRYKSDDEYWACGLPRYT